MKNLRIGFMRLPLLEKVPYDPDYKMISKMVDRFMNEGFTYFDTQLKVCRMTRKSASKNIARSFLRHRGLSALPPAGEMYIAFSVA